MKKIVLKISSGLLVNKNDIQDKWLDGLADFIAGLLRDDVQIWLVTSGAMAMYKLKNGLPTGLSLAEEAYKNGQKHMFEVYKEVFSRAGLEPVEVLVSKEDFRHRSKYLTIRTSLQAIAKEKKIALINEKETINAKHKFSDNDEIAGLAASVLDADMVIFASSVEGVLDNEGVCISEVGFGEKFWTEFIKHTISENGKGGMLLKCQAAEHSAQRGIDAFICDGRDIKNIEKISKDISNGTRFIADRRKAARKRWIFDKKDFARGWIEVDEGLAAAIRTGRPVSLLSVGVKNMRGDFDENEIVAIKHEDNILGYGEIRYGSKDLRRLIKNKNSRLLIHYDKYARIV